MFHKINLHLLIETLQHFSVYNCSFLIVLFKEINNKLSLKPKKVQGNIKTPKKRCTYCTHIHVHLSFERDRNSM